MASKSKLAENKKITLKFLFLSAVFILTGLFMIILPFINIKIDYPIIEKDIKVQSIGRIHHYKSGTDYELTADSGEKFRIDPLCCLKEFYEEIKEGDTAHIKYFKTYIFGIKRIEELSANEIKYVSQDYFKSGSKAIPIVLGSIFILFGCGGIGLGCCGMKKRAEKSAEQAKAHRKEIRRQRPVELTEK